jgi:FAD/FMN-containing dehydrogenase
MKQSLAAIVGRGGLDAAAASLDAYSGDLSFVPPVTPAFIVRPATADEVRGIVAWANATRTPLVPVSSGPPHFHGDTVPGAPGAVILDLTRLNRIRRIDRRNRVVVIEPGVTYAQLQSALAGHGMRVTAPLLPRRNKSVVASLLERQPTLIPRYNYSLPEPLRDCGVVWGSGEAMSTGEAGGGPLDLEEQWGAGGVQVEPKGPAQTDFYRLLTGAQGSMGVVTWASVKCELVPSAGAVGFVPADRLEDLMPLAYRLVRLRLGDEVLVVNDSCLARMIAAFEVAATVRRAELPAWTLIVGVGGREKFAQERVRVDGNDIRRLADGFGLKVEAALPGAPTSAVREVLGGLSPEPHWKLAARGGSADVFFLTTLDKAPRYLELAGEVATALGVPPDDLGIYIQPQHQGVAWHVELSLLYAPDDGAEAARAEEFHDSAAGRLIAAGAYFSRPYGAWAHPVYERDPVSAGVLHKVKDIFDPNGVMNPGKLCFAASVARREA